MQKTERLRVTAHPNGATFGTRVVPRASRNEIAGVEQGVLRVRLTAPPVEGAANKALVKLLARLLNVAERDVEIVAGQSGRHKVVAVSGLSAEEVEGRLTGNHPPRTVV